MSTSPADPRDPDADTAIARTEAALSDVAGSLLARAESASDEAAEILQMSAALASDAALLDSAAGFIRDGQPASHAVTLAVEAFCAQLEALGGYMAERVADLRDIGTRAAAVLLGESMPGVPEPGYPYILLARDLAPADTATLGDSDVIAIVTEEGGPTSHTAILAKSLRLPAIVACPQSAELAEGTVVAVDGTTGVVEVDPPADRIAAVEAAIAAARDAASAPTVEARYQHTVTLLANIGSVANAEDAVQYELQGVGLFRTEFGFLSRTDEPDVAEQTATYTAVFSALAGTPITIRTLDAGSDKPLPFLSLPDEENPALGIRGLRVTRVDDTSLRHQLEAIAAARTATGADVKVMAPMVTTATEARDFADLARSYGLPSVGVMIEVPAAALRAADILAEVDFVSIGTNDLAQYTFATDRMSGLLGDLLDPWQPALLDLIALVCDAGRAAGKPVGVCGESANDPLLAAVLTGLGVSSLSMSASLIAPVRATLGATSGENCERAAALARGSRSAEQARSTVAELLA